MSKKTNPKTLALWTWQAALMLLAVIIMHQQTQDLQKLTDLDKRLQTIEQAPTPSAAAPLLTGNPKQSPTTPNLLQLSLYQTAEESALNPSLAHAHLKALIAWLTPQKNQYNKTYQALLALQQAHPPIPWEAMEDGLKQHRTVPNITQSTHPWYTWQHWVHIQKYSHASARRPRIKLLHRMQQALEAHDLKTWQISMQALGAEKGLSTELQTYIKTWQAYVEPAPKWDVTEALNTLVSNGDRS